MQEIDFIKPNNSHRDPILKTKPYLIGVAGGSGSGKTFFAEALKQKLHKLNGKDICEIVCQDNFYIDQSKEFDRDGGSVNFDHPNSIDFLLLAKHLNILKTGLNTEIPIYDFASHKRKTETIHVEAKKIIIVDGILIFHSDIVRSLFDDLIFFETPEDLRFSRRLTRDVKERGRSEAGVREQFLKQVKPMHDLFVEPSKCFANRIVKDLDDRNQFNEFLKTYCQDLENKNRTQE